MLRFGALNERSRGVSKSRSGEESERSTLQDTQEVKESEALKLYQKAIAAHHNDQLESAEQIYKQLLQTKFVSSARDSVLDDENRAPLSQDARLKYLALKNLGNIAEKKSESKAALDYFIKAIYLDDSDAGLWFHVGVAAMQETKLILARHAVTQGLLRSKDHWGCLDLLCTILYALSDDSGCLAAAVKGLERSEDFVKGLVFVQKLHEESPYLLEWKEKPMKYASWLSTELDTDAFTEVLAEAQSLRDQMDTAEKESPTVSLSLGLTSLTWEGLGVTLLELYNTVKKDSSGRLWFGNYVKVLPPNPQPPVINPTPAFVLKPASPAKPIQAGVPSSSSDINESSVDGTATDGGRKPAKRKLPFPSDADGDSAPKRRSVRVRVNTRRKDTGNQLESVNYVELLEKYIPYQLKQPCQTDDAALPKKAPLLSSGKTQAGVIEGMTILWKEEEKVKEFLCQCASNGGVLDLMHRYLAKLGDPKQSQTKWPDTLIKVFLRVYIALREHIVLPLCPGQDESERVSVEKAQFCLCSCELQLDSHKGQKHLEVDSKCLLRDFHIGTSTTFGGDLGFLVAMTTARETLGSTWQNFAIRVYWLRGRFALLISHNEMAVSSFCTCLDLLAMERPVDAALDMLPRQRLTVQLPNCVEDCVINVERVSEKLDFIDRFKSVDEIRSLHEANDHKRVEEILTTSLKLGDVFSPSVRSAFPPENQILHGLALTRPSPERPSQLILLQDSLWKLDKKRLAFLCAEQNLFEVSCRISPQLFCKMAETLKEIVTFLEMASSSAELLLDVPDFILARLIQTSIKLIDCCMDSLDGLLPDAFPASLLWLLAYHLIKHGESLSIATPLTGAKDAVISSPKSVSLSFLRTAHDVLGRHSVCCESRSRFLFLALDAFLAGLGENPTEDLTRDVEQCFYCLFGHPSKKAKARKLQDHASLQIKMNQNGALMLFQFYFPKSHNSSITFESSRIYVTLELENLLRRITETIPELETPRLSMEALEGYLDGAAEDLPSEEKMGKSSGDPVVQEIYHLLATYYLKNGEHVKSAKMYMNDLCYNPRRFDSWAGLALAKAGRIEDKLNSLDGRTELSKFIERHSGSALRAFEMAQKITGNNCSLIKQHGLFVYTLFSFASQQAKQPSTSGSPVHSSIVQQRKEMLHKAKRLFEQCTEFPTPNDDAWFHHLMLAKIAEKDRLPCADYLQKYMQALRCIDDLHIDHPRKIDYRNLSPHAIEALEVYYCLHCSVLKMLAEAQVDYLSSLDFDTLEEYVELAGKSSFALAETRMPSKAGRPVSDINPPSINPLSPRSLLRQRMQVMKEHSYFSCSDSSQESMLKREDIEAEKTEAEDESAAKQKHVEENSQGGILTGKLPTQKEEQCVAESGQDAMADSLEGIALPARLSISPPAIDELAKQLEEDEAESDDRLLGPRLRPSVSPPPFDEIAEGLMDLEFGLAPPAAKRGKEDEERGPMERYMALVDKCLAALQLCSRRYPEHYKSIYRLAYAYSHIPTHMNLETARDIVWGPAQCQDGGVKHSVPPLFSKKGTVFFQIWKMRIDELERPGSFMVHVHKCVRLLVKVLLKLKDKQSLLIVAQMLFKKADPTKRHIRDTDRMVLAQETLRAYVSVIRDELNVAKLKEGETLDEERSVYLLGLLRETNQSRLLVEKNDCASPEIDECLADIFSMLLPRLPRDCSVISSSPEELRQQILGQKATVFCQSHFGSQSKQQADSSSSVGALPPHLKSSMEALFPSECK